jgi:hypothetical protein
MPFNLVIVVFKLSVIQAKAPSVEYLFIKIILSTVSSNVLELANLMMEYNELLIANIHIKNKNLICSNSQFVNI